MAEFRMPSLGADMEAGTLVEWLKQPGDPVARGDIVAVVETEKGAIEVETFNPGTFERALVEPGTVVPVGTPIAMIAVAGEAAAGAAPVAPPVAVGPVSPTPAAPAPAATPVMAGTAPSAAAGRPLASPAARRIAAERRLDLVRIVGTGPGGAITSRDVGPARPPARRGRGLDLGEMRRAIAAAMSRSKREIPHYYLATPIALERSLQWLERINTARPPADRLLVTVLLVKAVALALRRFPEFNGFHRDGGFVPGAGIHVGVAVAIRGGGLVAPAIRDTDQRDLDGLMRHLRDLVARARVGQLRSSELGDPTITVTALGDRGVEAVFGVIYPPQVALVGFGRPAERAVSEAGKITSLRAVTASLAADHRVSDGHRGALFLVEIERLLQEPETL